MKKKTTKSKSPCPFCSGSKTVSKTGVAFSIHKCDECEGTGLISNQKLVELELEDFIKKK